MALTDPTKQRRQKVSTLLMALHDSVDPRIAACRTMSRRFAGFFRKNIMRFAKIRHKRYTATFRPSLALRSASPLAKSSDSNDDGDTSAPYDPLF
jgi:hypothetical protein